MLSALMKKGWLAIRMTATPATVATVEAANQMCVAPVATVAVAENNMAAITQAEEAVIFRWLEHIGEFDLVMIDEVLNKCRDSAEAREYVLREAQAIPGPVQGCDDRRYCYQCLNLLRSGLCMAARRGELDASYSYHPVDDIPRRCAGYVPHPEDPDQRVGRDRWPKIAVSPGSNNARPVQEA